MKFCFKFTKVVGEENHHWNENDMEMEQLEITEKVSWIREGLEPPTPRLPVVCSYR